MKDLLNIYSSILRSPDDGGAGGAAAADAGGAAAASAAAAAAAGAASSGAGGTAAGGAPDATPAATPPDIYRPEGIADHLLGKSNNETIDNLNKALVGYRDRDAQNKVPEQAEAYSDFGPDVAPEIAPHIETLKGDPIYSRMANYALENKIPLPVYQGLVKQFMSAGQEMGLLEPPVDAAAEKAALIPEAARHLSPAEQSVARNKRMEENNSFIDAAVRADPAKDGGIDKDTADYVKAMLGDTARGHKFIEYVKTLAGGNQQQVYMGGAGAGVADPKAEISRRQGLPENTWGSPKFNQASYDALQQDLRKVYGE